MSVCGALRTSNYFVYIYEHILKIIKYEHWCISQFFQFKAQCYIVQINVLSGGKSHHDKHSYRHKDTTKAVLSMVQVKVLKKIK